MVTVSGLRLVHPAKTVRRYSFRLLDGDMPGVVKLVGIGITLTVDHGLSILRIHRDRMSTGGGWRPRNANALRPNNRPGNFPRSQREGT